MEPLNQIITFLKSTNELKTAEILLDTFAKYTKSFEQYEALSKSYHDIKQYQKSIKYVLIAMGMTKNPQAIYSLRCNLAKLYNNTNQPELALDCLNKNLKTIPHDADILLEKSVCLYFLNRKVESEQILLDLLKNPSTTDDMRTKIKFNLASYDLAHGKFQEGLRGFLLSGKKLEIWEKTKLDQKLHWDGSITPKTLNVIADGGIGDEFINVRFMKKLKDIGIDPIWYTDRKDLAKVFEHNGIKIANEIDKSIAWTNGMTLPIYLNVKPEELWDSPYIKADPSYIEKHRHYFDKTKINIGLRWGGNPDYEQNLHRELNIQEVYTQLKDINSNFRFYSLQKEAQEGILGSFENNIIDLSHELNTWDDTLGIIENLDFVVSSCTSLAHASAAMGKCVYILVPIAAYYTWECSPIINKSIWYGDTTTILRQTIPTSWKEPIFELTKLLSEQYD